MRFWPLQRIPQPASDLTGLRIRFAAPRFPTQLVMCDVKMASFRTGFIRIKNRLAHCLGILILFSLIPYCGALAQTTLTAQEFADSIGVDVHFMYTDGGYANLDKAVAALKYLGVIQVRDALPNLNWESRARYGLATSRGIKFDFFVYGSVDPAKSVERLDQFEVAFPEHISAIEGPNEVNNWPVKYSGLTGTQAAAALQNALFESTKADSLLKDIPVFNYTGFPDAGGKADFTNIHPYPKHGTQPRDELVRDLETYSKLTPGKPVVITETGYPTLNVASDWGGVDERTQALLTLNLLLDSASLGIRRTYLYQLLDAYPDHSGVDVDKHLGLFDLAYNPKRAAQAIHNFLAVLDAAHSNVTSPPSYSIVGLPSSARTLGIRRTDGAVVIAIWNEPKIWDFDRSQPIDPPKTPITVKFSHRVDADCFEPSASDSAVASENGVGEVDAELGADPILVVAAER